MAIADQDLVIASSKRLKGLVAVLHNAKDSGEGILMSPRFFNPSITVTTLGRFLILEGGASALEYTTALRQIYYVNNDAIPTTGADRRVSVTVADIDGVLDSEWTGSEASTTIEVVIDNQITTVMTSASDSSSYTATFFPGLGPIPAVSPTQAQITDVDSLYLTNVSVALQNIRNPRQEVLQTTFTSAETVSLPLLYQSPSLDLRFGRTWLARDRRVGALQPSGPDIPSIRSQITVSENFTVGRLDVIVVVEHSRVHDLKVELFHNRVWQTLVSGPGELNCDEDNLQGTVFSSTATPGETLSSSSVSPGLCQYEMRGVFAPEGNLSLFSGGSSEGVWELRVSDQNLTTENGRLTNWALLLQPLETHLVKSVEPVTPVQTIQGSLRRTEHRQTVEGSGGRITGLQVRAHLHTASTGSSRVFVPTILLQHPDGTQLTLLNCSSASCSNNSRSRDFLLFSDNATQSLPFDGPCCPSQVMTVSVGSQFSVANNTITTSEDCSGEDTNLVDILQPVDALSQLNGKTVDGEWKLIIDLPPSMCNDSQTVSLYGWSLYISREPNIDSTYSWSDGLLLLSGQDTPAGYTSVLRSVVYNNLAQRANFSTPRQIVVTASDGLIDSDSSLLASQSQINIHHLDLDLDPLRTTNASLPHFAVNFIEERPAVNIVDRTNAKLTDAAHTTGRYVLTVVLRQVANFGFEDVRLDTSAFPHLQVNRTEDASAGWIRRDIYSLFSPPQPISTFETVLRSAEYFNTAEELAGRTREVDFSVRDLSLSGLFFSVTATSSITMVPVNDPPVLDVNNAFSPLGNISNVVEYEEGQGPQTLTNASGILLYDYDNDYLESITISFNHLPDTSVYEVLSADTSGTNIVARQNMTGDGTLLLIGRDTIANYSQVLETVTYTNNKHGVNIGHPSTLQRLISFVPFDGAASGTAAVVDVTFVSVDDAPLIDLNGAATGIDFSTVFVEEGGSVLIVNPTGLTAFDVDNDSLSYASARIENIYNNELEVLTVSNVTQRVLLSGNGKLISETNLSPMTTYNFSSGELIITGLDSVAEYQTVLRTLRYNNLADEQNNVTRTIVVTLSDGLKTNPEARAYVDLVPVNDRPFFNNNSVPTLSFDEDIDDVTNTGISLDRLASLIEDDDANAEKGLAVFRADGRGVWQYKTNNSWFSFPNSSILSFYSAVVIRALPNNAFRFIPDQDFHGDVSLSFLAWDVTSQTSSSSDGSQVNAWSNRATSPFSRFTNQRTLRFTFVPVNDAPILPETPIQLTTILEDDRSSRGDSVDALLVNVRDVDLLPSTRPMGVAIVETDETNGRWQYSQDNGQAWADIRAVSVNTAFLIPAENDTFRLRFWPNQDFNGEVEFTYHAWDLTADQTVNSMNMTLPTGSVDISTSHPVTGAYSTNNNTASLTVQPVNDSPVLGTNISIWSIMEDIESNINHGTTRVEFQE